MPLEPVVPRGVPYRAVGGHVEARGARPSQVLEVLLIVSGINHCIFCAYAVAFDQQRLFDMGWSLGLIRPAPLGSKNTLFLRLMWH